MGPTCEVMLEAIDGPTLGAIDAVLVANVDRIERTRKGRAWDIWVGGHPVHVSVSSQSPIISLAAGCNDPDDRDVLRRLAGALVEALSGVASLSVK